MSKSSGGFLYLPYQSQYETLFETTYKKVQKKRDRVIEVALAVILTKTLGVAN